MKKETIEKGNKILKLIALVEDRIQGLTIMEGKPLDQIEIRIGQRNNIIDLYPNGKINKPEYLSDTSKDILAYLAKSFHTQVLSLFQAELEGLQKEFKNLKDE